MAESSNYFWDYYFEAILTDECREPLILQIRDALASLDDSNHGEVNIIVKYLLGETTYDDTPSTLEELMRELAKLNSRSVNGRKLVPNEDIDNLVHKMRESLLITQKLTKAEAVALGLADPSGFVPSLDNPFFEPFLDLCSAARHIARVFTAAKDAALEWHNMLTHQGPRFRDYMQKIRVSPRHHVRLLIRDLKRMSEFLDNGRAGWRLITWRHTFYQDVLPVTTDFINTAQQVGAHKGCQAIREVVVLAVDIRARLGEFQKLRWEAEDNCRRQHQQEKTEYDVKADEHIRNMMEKMNFREQPAGLLPGAQQEGDTPTVEKAASDFEQMGLMEKLEEELEEDKQAHVAPEEGIDDLDIHV